MSWYNDMRISRAIMRAVWGFFAFIPFCWLWGVDNFTWFAFIGTLYFVPVHWVFDRIYEGVKNVW
jgi:hypothetical protein